MIVCVCANVNEKQIQERIEAGSNLETLKVELGVCLQCGSCELMIQYMIENHLKNNQQGNK